MGYRIEQNKEKVLAHVLYYSEWEKHKNRKRIIILSVTRCIMRKEQKKLENKEWAIVYVASLNIIIMQRVREKSRLGIYFT